MFALIVGAAIIGLAIYFAVSFVKTGNSANNAELGKELGTILSPIETNLEITKSPTPITFPTNTRIYNDCDLNGNFGTQLISVVAESSIGDKWAKPKNPTKLSNKYLFSSSIVEGKAFYILVAPFNMPYKIADLIIMWSEKERYCFVNPPNDIASDIQDFNLKNINITENARECVNSTKVCFSGSDCEINVDSNSKSVKRKGEKTVYYDDKYGNSLLYAAIFSNSLVYECQLKRLMKRNSELSSLYLSKSLLLNSQGCGSSVLQPLFAQYATKTKGMNNTVEIRSISTLAQGIEDENKILSCKVF